LRLLDRDYQGNRVRLRVDGVDDLWFLEKLLLPGTVLGSETQRRLDPKPDKLRPDRTERIRVFLQIGVEATEFQEFRDVLRVKGRILEGPPGVEGHHTLAIGPGTVLELTFPALTGVEMGIIDEAVGRSYAPKALAVYVDDRTEQLFRLHDYGIEELGSSAEVTTGKMFDGGTLNGPARFAEITTMIKAYIQSDTPVVIVGPGFFKELLGTHLRSELGIPPSRFIMAPSSSSGKGAILEVMTNSKGIPGLLGTLRLSQEMELLRDLMERIGTGGLATYGRSEVLRCLETGAVEHLLLSEERFGEERGGPVMERCLSTGARSTIISVRHEPGRMFAHMGGIAALLRYRTNPI
jgi:protein pelota